MSRDKVRDYLSRKSLLNGILSDDQVDRVAIIHALSDIIEHRDYIARVRDYAALESLAVSLVEIAEGIEQQEKQEDAT